MNNAQPGPGPSTARIKFTLPAASRLPSANVENSTNNPAQPSLEHGTDVNLQPSGNTPRQPVRRRQRGTGASRTRGGGTRGYRHNPPRHSSVRASSRISLLTDADHGDPNSSRRLTLSFNKNGTAREETEGGRKTSFLGEYDRDLDENPTEPLAFEEQFILRVPETMAGSLREMAKGKAKGLDGVEFRFLDTRRAAFRFEGKTYSSKLVDLPNIIESQKTFDSRHLFKVADISQMLVVGDRVNEESQINASALNIDDFIWPHGVTPPLKHVRKRRFRKRVSRRAIEVVEEQVEELLGKDEGAEDIQTDLIDVNPGVDVPDTYYIDFDPDAVWYSHADGEGSEFGGSEIYEDPGSVIPQSDLDENGFYDDRAGSEGLDESDEDVYDDDLAAALRQELADVSDEEGGSDAGDGSGDDEDEEGARSGDDEEDEELVEKKDKIKQFNGEIKILESTIEKKRSGFTGGNPIMVKRFEETIAGLQADVNTKVSARQTLLAELESIMLAKAKAAHPPQPEAPAPIVASTSDARVLAEEDDEDDVEDGEEDGEETGPATPTPDVRRSEPDNDEDLFGDDDEDSYDEDGDHEQLDTFNSDARESSILHQDLPDDESSSEPEHEIDEEMAALLQAELNDIEAGEEISPDDAGTLRELHGMTVEYPAGDSDNEMDPVMSSAQKPTFGVEGGVGMRRLATGVLDEGDGSSDSDDSDD